MDENLEERLAQLVADLTPEHCERWGSGLKETGLALAELREVQRDYSEAMKVLKQALRDLDRAEERARNALRLLGLE
jgi:hypothetical protein